MEASRQRRGSSIKISNFIKSHRESIIEEWKEFADTVTNYELTSEELLDSVSDMVDSIVRALELSERKGRTELRRVVVQEIADDARAHASDRLMQRFTLKQLAAEYQALRANVMHRWIKSLKRGGTRQMEELARFNAAVDLSLSVAVAWYDDRLREQRQELRAVDRAKNEFLAVLGHELRNPLAPLRTGLDLLERARTNPELLDTVSPMMERQFSHLSRLVDDLLDLARISRGQVSLRPAPVDLNAAIQTGIEQLSASITDGGHTVIEHLSPAPLWVSGDFERLTQVVANLISNACRYMEPEGRIFVTSDAESDEAIVRVRDTGYGIPPDRLGTVFELFQQIPEHRTKTGGGGLGIGLALSRRLVELHGGSIEAQSDGMGHGSEFILRLPLMPAQPSRGRGAEAADDATPAYRLLVVDDNRDAADALRTETELMGHTVRTAYDGASAVDEIEQFKPEVLILDLGLPGMDGVEVARRVRAMPGGEQVFLIALTGWGGDEDRRRTELAGFDHHLIKPVGAEQLRQLLASVRGNRPKLG